MIRLLVRLIRQEVGTSLRAYGAMLVASAAARAASCVLLVPLVARLFSADPSAAWPWLGALTAATVASWEIDRRLSRRSFAIGFALLGRVQRRLVDHLGTLPLGWFRPDTRAAAQRVVATSGPEVVGLLSNIVSPVVGALLLPLAIALALLVVAWPVGLAALVAAPAILAALVAGNRLLRRSDLAFTAATSEVDARVVEFGQAQRVLRSAGQADPARSAAGRAIDGQRRASLRVLGSAVPGQLLFGLASQLGLLALAGTAVVSWRDGDLSAAQTVAVLVVGARYLEPFRALSDLAPGLETSRNLLRRLSTVLDAEPLAAPTQDPAGWTHPVLGAPPTVELDGVAFAYPGPDGRPGPAVLDGCSFTVPAGTTTAIVGPSGSGKSTVLGLLSRFHDVDAGAIRIDGHDLRDLPLDTLAAVTSAVHQDVYLFDGTIRDNVVAADPDIDDGALAEVAALTQVAELVERLADGWSTRVGEGGTSLSGGERQRVSVARALVKPAPVLLVDEATSALDAESSGVIVAALAAEAGRRTTIVVAHRIETIEHADQVVFLEDGRIVEQGSPAELVAAGGRFADFWRQQRASRGWTIGRHA